MFHEIVYYFFVISIEKSMFSAPKGRAKRRLDSKNFRSELYVSVE